MAGVAGGSGRGEVGGSSGGRLAVAAAVVAGVAGGGGTGSNGQQEPLGCWICSSQLHGSECYHPLNQTTSFVTNATRNCSHEEVFCTVSVCMYIIGFTYWNSSEKLIFSQLYSFLEGKLLHYSHIFTGQSNLVRSGGRGGGD